MPPLRFLRKVLCLSIRKEEGETEWAGAVEYSFCKMDSQCRVTLLAGARSDNGYLIYTRLLTVTRGPRLFFEMTLASLKN
jgi:hypothetical protein